MTSEWLPRVAFDGMVTDFEIVPVLEVVTVAKRTGSLWNGMVALVFGAQPLHETATLAPRAGVVSEAVQVGNALADGVGELLADAVGDGVPPSSSTIVPTA